MGIILSREFMDKNFFIIGNWKMHKTTSEALQFLKELSPLLKNCKVRAGIAVPFTSLEALAEKAKPTNLFIGAQNIYSKEEGAYTGEISARMIKTSGASFVLLGHSERRQHFHENDEDVNAKVRSALQAGLQPILCIGETQEEREKDHEAVLQRHIEKGLKNLLEKDVGKVIIAYEPVWAIGTGKTATPEVAEETHSFCRKCLSLLYGEKIAKSIPILYGGSVKPENIYSLLAKPNIDGALVGGASLDVKKFGALLHYDKEDL